MRTRLLSLFSLLTICGCASNADPRKNVDDELEVPEYEVVKQAANFELRKYESYIVASVTVEGDYDAASRDGFRLLADYIFGANESQTEIAMTAPVSSTPAPKSEQIAMTAPVRASAEAANTWEISFSMPSKYSLETLPTPKSDRIQFVERPPELTAASIFPGFTTMAALREQEEVLTRWVEQEGLIIDGPFVVARYNDPYTFPWNRRNEIIVKVLKSE